MTIVLPDVEFFASDNLNAIDAKLREIGRSAVCRGERRD
jgi:hypothetical protein